VSKCKGCEGDHKPKDITEDGFCESCQYQHEANKDNLTDGDHE